MNVAAVNPITNYSYVNPSSAYANNNGGLTVFEQLLLLQTENSLLTTGTSTANGGTASNSITTNNVANDNILLNADLLELNPAALDVLNGVTLNTGINNTDGNVGDLLTQNLTPVQQQQAADIIAQYANQPFTQQTYSEMAAALTAVGINPSQISIEQMYNYYEYPYQAGLAFNGQLYTEVMASELLDS